MTVFTVPYDEIIKEGMVGSQSDLLLPLNHGQELRPSSIEFTRMSNAIAELSRSSGKPPILFSLCQWGRVGTE